MSFEDNITDKSRFRRYRTISGHGITFGYLYKTGTFKTTDGACHAKITASVSVADVPVRFYSQLRRGLCDSASAHAYWDAVFSNESPWSLVLKDLEIYSDKDGYYAFSIAVDGTTPSQVMANLAVATRFPFEHSKMCTNFKMFNERFKLDVRRSILLAHLYRPGVSQIASIDLGHIAITPNTIDPHRIINGDPVYNTHMLVIKGASYMPCNAIWKDGKRPSDYYNPCAELKNFVNSLVVSKVKTESKMKFKNKFESLSAQPTVMNGFNFPVIELEKVVEGMRNYV